MRRNQTIPHRGRGEGGSRLFRFGGWVGIGVGVSLLLLLALDLVVMPRLTRHGDEATTPSVLGLTLAEANRVLAEEGFTARVEARRPDPANRYAPGEVMGQYPRAGRRAKKGRVIQLTLSAGGRQSRVPDLLGVTLRQALGLIADARLREDSLARHWRHDERWGEGTVLAQRPAAGDSLAPGDALSLTISLGPAPDWVSTPRVVGLPMQQAVRLLEQSGLTANSLSGPSATGEVASQDPAPGTPMVPGSAVDLGVSTIPEEQP